MRYITLNCKPLKLNEVLNMKIRIVSSREEIKKINANEEIIHLTFRPSNADIFDLIKMSPNIKAIQIPTSYRKTISKSIQMFLDMQNIELLEGDVWGHRSDISNYSEISQTVYDMITDFRKEGLSDDEIKIKLTKLTKLDESVINFLLK